jgi:flagellar motor switch protein FliM
MAQEDAAVTQEVESEQAAQPAAEQDGGAQVRSYDFRRPRHLSADQVRNLHRLHSTAAEQVQQRLSRYMGIQCDVKLRGIEEMDYDVFIQGCTDPLYVNQLDLSPITARGLLIFDVELCLAFVDRVLGGQCKAPAATRTMTAIDQAAAETTVEVILRCLRESWKEVYPMKMTVLDRRNDIQNVRIVVRGEPVLVVTFDLSGEPGAGRIRLLLPLPALKSATDTVAHKAAVPPSAEKAAKLRENLMRSIERAKLPVLARLGATDVPLRGLAGLRSGDILRLDQTTDSPVVISVGGKPAFIGRMGLRGRKKAVQVTERIKPNEEE